MLEYVHNALTNVKSKCTHDLVQYARMEFDDRPEPAKRLEQARKAKGYASAREAAKRFGWSYDSYAQHENGQRGLTRSAGKYAKAYGVTEAWLLGLDGAAAPSEDDPQNLAPEEKDFLDRLSRLKTDQRSVLRALMDVMGASSAPARKRSPPRTKREA